jgi:superfamily II DNA/RNA helicase
MTGKDVCGRAQTGSGKTLAFGVPMLARITEPAEPSKPLGLVLVPTRELAVQVAEVLQPIAQHANMTVLPVYGGASRHHQIDELAKGVEVVVATPLRLIDLVKSGEVTLDECEIVTLDEADRMADDGFTPQVEWILRHCTGRTQMMLFSATLDGDVGHLIRHYQDDPETVAIDDATDTVGTMHHLFLAAHHMDKDKVIGSIGKSVPKVLVFCQTKRNCDRVAANLDDLGVNAAPLHGDMQQSSRERVLRRFAEGKLSVLVATDVAARGIDIDDIGAVIHYQPAKDVKDYLHRSGRTARAGRDGWAVTLVEYNQHTQVRILQRGMRLPNEKAIEVFSNDVRLLDLSDFEVD